MKKCGFIFQIIVVALVSINCKSDEVIENSVAILFVGNSLTYTNNLPQLVVKEAERYNKTVHTKLIAHPNYALEDHWLDGQIQKEIASGNYNYVVVQQGPSSQADGLAMLLKYGSLIKKLCSDNNAQLAFFMVWPARNNYYTFPGVIANHSEAAMKTNSILCPVGSAWKLYMDNTRDYSYYSVDEFHPSLSGSKVAAEIIARYLFNP